MALSRISPPPVNVDANDFTFKKWFQDIYTYNNGGILVPVGGNTNYTSYRRNILLNGDFQIWQRGTSFVSAAANTYTADRWSHFRAGAGLGGQVTRQLSGLQGFKYCARVQRASANALTTSVILTQSLESDFCSEFAGQNVTYSFWCRAGSNLSTTVQAIIVTGTGTDQSIFSGFTGSASVTKEFTPTSTWQYYSFTTTLPTTTNQIAVSVQMKAPSGTAGANDYFEVTGLQLESGIIPTVFEFKNFTEQWLQCCRYYQKSFPYATAPAQNAGLNSAYAGINPVAGAVANFGHSVPFTVLMRVAPTVVCFNTNAANAFARNLATGTDATATAASGVTSQAVLHMSWTGLAGWGVGNLIMIHWTADAEI